MKRIAFRLVPAVALVRCWVSRGMSPPRVRAEQPVSRARRMVTGRHYTADIRGSKYSPLVKSTPATSARWKWPGGSRPTTSARAPRPSSKARRSRSAARSTPRRHAPRGRVARRQDRRAKVDVRDGRRRARHALGAASAVRPRPLLLDRRQRRRAHPLRDDRLSPRRAQRQDRSADPGLRQQRASSI